MRLVPMRCRERTRPSNLKPDQEVGKLGMLRASTRRGVLAIDSDCLSSAHIDSDMRLG